MEKSKHQNCDLFSFMANTVGIKVLHPGGYKSTDELCSALEIGADSHVLDVACGTGTTAFYLSQKYNCHVTGFDISDNLIEIARKSLGKNVGTGKIKFEVADVLEMPYPDNSYDIIISQAFFVLIDEKEKALKELVRVLKPGGYLGSLELGWFKKTSSRSLRRTC